MSRGVAPGLLCNNGKGKLVFWGIWCPDIQIPTPPNKSIGLHAIKMRPEMTFTLLSY